MKEIKLNHGLTAIVDGDDFDLVSSIRWRAKKSCRTTYAAAGPAPIYMHRLILGAEKGQICDHINHNGLDNRRQNLRLCTPLQSVRNTRSQLGGVSRFKGVYKAPGERGYTARISVRYRRIYLGYFQTEEEAAIAYNEAAIKYFGEFAFLNEVKNA